MFHKYQKSRSQVKEEKQKERKAFDDEVDSINERLNQIAHNNYIDPGMTDEFSSLPILESTKKSLEKSKFTKMSPIQKQTLLYTLCGRDIIGAAETGSGKTLAFCIPIVESLKKAKFSKMSGIGAIIISPTRDLAAQTFDVLKKLIKDTDISAGLITGGMDFEMEQEGLSRLNIIICTMGRLKEHMETTSTFNADHLQILVLDEADKLMNKEFIRDLKHVIADLPDTRQTMLFTATATKAIKDISKLSLSNPARVNLTEERSTVMPESLIQFYAIVNLSEKWNTLFSFLKMHLNDKIIVFMETVKMVRFAYEAFKHLRPGLPILHLTGKQNSNLRFDVIREFKSQKRCAIFTTDVAARGLDFPDITWVVQMDCPSSTDTYIHRAGRTARFHKMGKSIVFLTPSEKMMVEKLAKLNIELKGAQIIGDNLVDIRPRLVDICARFSDVKHLAMKAVTTYIRSVKHHEDGEVFVVQNILDELEDFSKSFGLLSVPVRKQTKKVIEEKSDNENESSDDGEEDDEEEKSDDFFEVVDDEDDKESKEIAESSGPKPTTMEFRSPDEPIPQEEYEAWRNRLKNLLSGEKKPKSEKKTKEQHRKEREEKRMAKEEREEEEEEEEKKEKTLEEAAAEALLDDLD
ncbi:DEAD/DEAH box helicase family protein [Trichomonas vaginalis G3]|uniref:ATP-dependent RNA helicase n=1 Tax=Trichomonas vaginalis (strain ATCC PRA-98 / G3) TaxID=412133 RepID=A2FYU9_TRIV3|nr:box C/D snoRNA binding protein family [Trichomonas vaginalis G3]EAX89911.1 DEAD/DEAH box helicase family protein [Trichomonas vaginalis G3]KAI5535742.1 box C/D snoRNA binding protein family [Trichomonas vaginalis G3]|eukprot:XP_001302841.1 DEAD/DEAH box helicase family protein [Trichomonas vaginalis G3]